MFLGASGLCDFEYIEAHSLDQGPALAHCGSVANLGIPERGQVHGHVLMVFLKVVILSDVVEVTVVFCIFALVITPDRICPWMETSVKGHFWSILSALSGLLGRLEAQTDVSVVSQELLQPVSPSRTLVLF